MNSILILLAAHNGKSWLAEQVDSILGQQSVELSLLIGDDCSTDGAVEDIQRRSPDSRLRTLRFDTPSGGAGQSFLRLLSHADFLDFDFVAFSDQDDVWNPDKLLRAITALTTNQATGYSSAVLAVWPNGRERVLIQNPDQTDLDFLFEGAGQGCSFVLRADFVREVQKFVRENNRILSNIHYHDWFVYAASRAWNKRWVFDPIPSMHYRQHGGNDTGARHALAGVLKRVELIRSGWYARQVQTMINAASAICEPSGIIPIDFRDAWDRPHGSIRRCKLAHILARRGRRRASDRAILAISALLGWI